VYRRLEEMIFERFCEVAKQHWDQPAILDGEQWFTYGRLLEEAVRHRGWLKATLNPQPGDVIAATMLNSWQFAACVLALADLRAVFMPCNPQWRAQELRGLTARLGFHAVVAERQFRSEWDDAGAIRGEHVLAIDDALTSDAGPPESWLPDSHALPEEAVLYLATSGSTGTPRILPRSHRNQLASIENSALAMGIESGDRFLSVVPFHHLHGFNNCMLMPLLQGASLVIMRHFVPEEYAELVARHRATILIGSPVIFSHLADRVTNPALFQTVRLCVSSGARLPPPVAQNWKNRFGSDLVTWYGASEAGGIAIACSPRQPSPELGGDFAGIPIPNVEVKCLDEQGNDLGPGRVGEIAVRSDAVMAGYLGEPELNQRVFHNGFFRTGDLGYLDTGGGLFLRGRIGRVINMGGVKVDPVEIERAVESLPGISSVYVDAVPGGHAGEVIRARVLLRPGANVTRADVIGHCRRMLGEYKLPRVIEFVDSSPATVTGKTPRSVSAG
jgi:acyl-CoA synthetase (AMP-forming)/AMP-acid ligase II